MDGTGIRQLATREIDDCHRNPNEKLEKCAIIRSDRRGSRAGPERGLRLDGEIKDSPMEKKQGDSTRGASEQAQPKKIYAASLICAVLLIAYVISSVFFSGQLFSLMGEDYRQSFINRIIVMYLAAPVFVLVLGWITLLQLAVSTLNTLSSWIYDSEGESNLPQLRFEENLKSRLRLSITLLVFAWVLNLIIVSASPLFINFYF